MSVILPEWKAFGGLTSLRETQKRIPHKWVQLQGLNVALYSLVGVLVGLPEFTLQAENCGSIW
jgi:hypothetical protein